MGFELHSYPDDAALAKAVGAGWLRQLQTRKDAKTPYTVALSGGRIARTFFAEIRRQVGENRVAFKNIWANVHFFWADERCVPPSDPESNFAVARQILFEPLKIPEGQIHRIPGEQPEPLALRQAVSDVLGVAPVGGNGQPIFDMVFLGMGEDGHVASLFPGEPGAVMASPAICRSVTAVKPPPQRITLGYGAIAAAVEVWVLVSGAGKQTALEESLLPAGKTPLARVLRLRERTKIFSDVEPR